ncbi:uncharacterized protein N7446_001945 [Penicillium canescens]|uniref:uncharacterized protein n=1 Tax=Penicillium canescens TaxID=5083 RepID=UPI0026E06CE5|nr:uncharacterized protein N7446_001945 [Penicillium canescens]KAJ6074168.1 hypothetical protein N7446_001945 [Penicillium canescens]
MEARNRKQRRAAASSSNKDEPEITYAQPPRNGPTKNKATVEKTLYDIIAERQKGLNQSNPSSTIPEGAKIIPERRHQQPSIRPCSPKKGRKSAGGTATTTKDDESEVIIDKPLPPFLDTILLSLPLTTLHLTLGYIAAHQYAESIDLPKLFKDSVTTAFPLLTLFVHLAHGHIISFKSKPSSKTEAEPSLFPLTSDKLTFSFFRKLVFPPALRTFVFLPVAVVLGAHLIAITNGEPYYAIMKKAPAVGTIWIWSILELSFGAAVIGALGPLAWGVWWMGYGIF